MRDERFPTISVLDPALDTGQLSADDLITFFRTRDFAIVNGKWLPGKQPTVYHVREIPQHLMETYVQAVPGTEQESLPERCRRAFECAVFSVENHVGNDGVAVPRWEPSRKRETDVMMTREESYRFVAQQRQEIGMVALMHSFLPRMIELNCALPSFVDALLARRPLRPVAPSSNTATAPNSEAQLPPAEEAPEAE